MTRRVRFPEPTPQDVAARTAIVSTLMDYALEKPPVTKVIVEKQINLLLNAAERGDPASGMKPVSYFPIFKPHIDAAAKAENGALLSALALALILIGHLEMHMPTFVAMIRSRQAVGRDSAARRKAEGANVFTRIEAWERENNCPLSPSRPPEQIANCAAAIDRSESTVKNALYKRERTRRQSRP